MDLVIAGLSLDCHQLRFHLQVSSTETHYRGLAFYLDEHPELLCDLLGVLQSRLDHGRVVDMMRRANQLPLIKDYLLGVQVGVGVRGLRRSSL